MLKQALIYLIVSIFIVIFAAYFHVLIVYIDVLYTYINIKLTPIFSDSDIGILIRNIFTLTLLPIILSAIPALIYKLFKRKTLPYFLEITWFFWFVIVLSKILIN